MINRRFSHPLYVFSAVQPRPKRASHKTATTQRPRPRVRLGALYIFCLVPTLHPPPRSHAPACLRASHRQAWECRPACLITTNDRPSHGPWERERWLELGTGGKPALRIFAQEHTESSRRQGNHAETPGVSGQGSGEALDPGPVIEPPVCQPFHFSASFQVI
jgi:hypothetical protein